MKTLKSSGLDKPRKRIYARPFKRHKYDCRKIEEPRFGVIRVTKNKRNP